MIWSDMRRHYQNYRLVHEFPIRADTSIRQESDKETMDVEALMQIISIQVRRFR